MRSGDLSTDLALPSLTPAPAVRPVDGKSSQQDAESKARRRPRAEDEDSEADVGADDSTDNPVHQIDRLA